LQPKVPIYVRPATRFGERNLAQPPRDTHHQRGWRVDLSNCNFLPGAREKGTIAFGLNRLVPLPLLPTQLNNRQAKRQQRDYRKHEYHQEI
jgi:hypothetical protein